MCVEKFVGIYALFDRACCENRSLV